MHKVQHREAMRAKREQERGGGGAAETTTAPAISPFASLLDSEQQGSAATSTSGGQLALFVRRMRESGREFYVQNRAANTVQRYTADFADDDDAAVAAAEDLRGGLPLTDPERQAAIAANRKLREEWTRACTVEYMQRQQAFRGRAALITKRLWLLCAVVLVAAVGIGYSWPVWDALLDIETNTHLETLGLPSTATTNEIRKAYRTLTMQWHPDKNPGCGQKCRDMTMKIQEAYDRLLAKGDREEAEARRQNQYKDALMQLRYLIFFRAYSIAFHTAEFINLQILSLPIRFLRQRAVRSNIENGVRVLIVLAFNTAEIVLVTGLNPVVLMQAFYFMVNMVTSNARKRELEKITKRSNFDYRKDLLLVAVPVLLHGLYFMCFEKYPQVDVFIFHAAVGFAFVASHLARFGPNLFDNWQLKKVSVTTQYMASGTGAAGRVELHYSRWNFFTTECSVLLDDLFAFTSNVPAVFRIAVLVVHAAYLAQLSLLPWCAPVKGRLQRRFQEQQTAQGKRVGSDMYSDEDEETAGAGASAGPEGSEASSPWAVPVARTRPLRDVERAWMTNIDQEVCGWSDVAVARFAATMAQHSTPNVPNTTVQLGVTPDLQDVLVLHINSNRGAVPAGIKDEALQGLARQQGPQAPTVRLVERRRDPIAAAILYRDAGDGAVVAGIRGVAFTSAASGDATTGPAATAPADASLGRFYAKLGGAHGLDGLSNDALRRIDVAAGDIVGIAQASREAVVSVRVPLAPSAAEGGAPARHVTWRIVRGVAAFNLFLSAVAAAALVILFWLPAPAGGPRNHQTAGAASAARSFEPFLTPVTAQKYYGLLPPDHPLNAFAAGALVLPPLRLFDGRLPTALFLPDMWDALRQLELYAHAAPPPPPAADASEGPGPSHARPDDSTGKKPRQGRGKKGSGRR